jgi:thiol-disulfide isomerase/thioredoxin
MSLVRRKHPLLVLLLVASTLAISPAHPALPQEHPFPWHEVGEDGSVKVNLYVFWAESCPHCHRALRFLDALEQELSWLEVRPLEVSSPENLAAYSALAEQLGADARYVPAFFYCGQSFQGYDDDATTGRSLRQSLEACRAELLAQMGTGGSPATDRALAAPGAPPIDLPLLGRLDPSALSLPVLTLILGTLDAFNPCAFFVLLFLLSLMVHARSRARMALVGGVFVLFSGVLYFAFMAAWLNLFLLVGYLPLVTIGAGLVALFVGAINIKDFVWPKRGISLSIPERAKPGFYARTRDLVGAANLPAMLAGTVTLALAANAYELLCTAGFPLVFTRILTLSDLSTPAYYGYLALYNAVYVLPLLAIVIAFVITLGGRKLKEEEGRILKLLSGLMMLGLGLVLLLAPGALSDPLTALALIMAALAVTALAIWVARRTDRFSRAAP